MEGVRRGGTTGRDRVKMPLCFLPFRDDNRSCVHGLTGSVGSGTWGGRAHDHECTGWVVNLGCSLCSKFLVILEESRQFKGLGDFLLSGT